MKAFIYDKYGYYPPSDDSLCFEYKGWIFKLELSEKNDYELAALKDLLKDINTSFPTLASDIILSKDNHYVVNSEYGPVSLVAMKNSKIHIEDLTKLSLMYLGKFNNKYKISSMRNLWIHKVDYIEHDVLESISKHTNHYFEMVVLAKYAIGLGENAIQYLLDIVYDYQNEIPILTLAHKRINKLDYSILNPLNLIIDAPIRDYSELYKNNLISLKELKECLIKINADSFLASLLLARVIYPSDIFDLYEDFYELKENISSRVIILLNDLVKRKEKIKILSAFLAREYHIKPINWLI